MLRAAVPADEDLLWAMLGHASNPEGPANTLERLRSEPELARYVVEKGSITVDGISLTVSGLGADWFEVSLIPTTLALTTLGRAPVGSVVNLEVDVIAKYVERLLAANPEPQA